MARLRTSLVAALAGLSAGMHGYAQTDAGTAAPTVSDARPAQAPTAIAANPSLNLAAATSAARLALIDLRGIQNPTPDDFTVCGMLLRQASELVPDHTQILRARVEAAHGAGNDAEVLAATRDLVRADPQDTVAQLRLISGRLAQMQTAQERMAAYQQFLGSSGAKLDPSIRSRLALDAALLARELGDEKGFVANLKLANSLDGTNKDAALLALSYFSESVKDRAAHFELLTNVFYADPLDPGTMMQLRDELAAAGAWDQAQRFHRMAVAVLTASGDIQMNDRLAEHGVAWHIKGPGDVLQALNSDLRSMRYRQEQMFSRKTRTMEGGYDVRKPEDVRHAVPMDQLRLAAALAVQDTDAVASIVKDLIATNEETTAVLADSARRPQSMDDEDARRKTIELKIELSVWRLLALQGVEDVAATEPELRAGVGDDDDLAVILRAWVAVRTGHGDEAERIATESGVSSGWLGVAMAAAREAKGDKAGAAAVLRSVAQDEPLTALGCYASWHAKELDPAFVSPLTAQMDRLARNVPLWVDSMIARPTQHQRLMVELDKREARSLEPIGLTLRLKNLSPIPLSLGTDQAINARLLLIPTVETGENDLVRRLSADVVVMDQRLRLMPGEELSLRLDPSIGALGWVTGTASNAPLTEKYRVLQGFVTGEERTRSAGPGCLDVTSTILSRSALDASRSDPARLAEQVANADEAQLARLAVATRAIMVPAQIASVIGDGHDVLAKAWAVRYPTLSRQAKIIALCELPPSSEVMAMKPFDDAAADEQDAALLRMVLVSRVAHSDSAVLDRAEAAGDEALTQIARIHRARLLAGAKAYAVQGVTAGLAAAQDGDGRR